MMMKIPLKPKISKHRKNLKISQKENFSRKRNIIRNNYATCQWCIVNRIAGSALQIVMDGPYVTQTCLSKAWSDWPAQIFSFPDFTWAIDVHTFMLSEKQASSAHDSIPIGISDFLFVY